MVEAAAPAATLSICRIRDHRRRTSAAGPSALDPSGSPAATQAREKEIDEETIARIFATEAEQGESISHGELKQRLGP